MAERFLIVRLVALGDVIHASAVVSRIRADHPDAHVAWLCGRGAEPLVRLFPGVDEVIAVDERPLLRGSLWRRVAAVAGVWRALAGKRFDMVLLLHADHRYDVLLLPLLPVRVIAARHSRNGRAVVRGNRFRGDELARLLDQGAARDEGPVTRRHALADVRAGLPAPAGRGAGRHRPRVVLVPGGTRNILREESLRRWPVASYRRLAEELLRDGYEVALVGDAADADAARHFDGLAVTSHVGTRTLVETLCIMRDADVVVSHDTGPLHFARLVRTPAVALFGPTDPRHFVGDDPSVRVLWGGAGLACRPCYDGRTYAACTDNLCMQGISVPQVVGAVRDLVDAIERNQPETARSGHEG